MGRWTIASVTAIVVLLACGQAESLEDRLIEAEKRLAEVEERITAYEWETATLTPAPTATPTLLSGAGLTIRERYEDLARVGLVVRTEERRTLSGCNNPARCNVSDWKYEDVTVFTVPEGAGWMGHPIHGRSWWRC